MIDPYHEVLRRFPEIVPHLCEGDEELPYLYFSSIAWWIESLPRSEVSDDIIRRISSFGDWCFSQPEGKDASDDLGTILMVGLYESLGGSDSGRKVLSSIWPEDYVLTSREYLTQWLGSCDYERLLTEYRGAYREGQGFPAGDQRGTVR
jgi:hypothetical protein